MQNLKLKIRTGRLWIGFTMSLKHNVQENWLWNIDQRIEMLPTAIELAPSIK